MSDPGTGPDADPAPGADPAPDGGTGPGGGTSAQPDAGSRPPGWSRRRVLAAGIGGVVVLAAGATAALDLVNRGVLPGTSVLDAIDGACSIPAPTLHTAAPGPATSSTFHSAARNREVGYTIAYPPGHSYGDRLPLVVMLHGFGGNHTDALAGLTPAQALALRVGGRPLPPMAMVTVDGGGGYWTPHPGDDPMAMVVDELIPLCRGLGLGRPPLPIGVMGISMGGFGALAFGEQHPSLFRAVAAISPAVWTSYAQARAANAGAYASAAAFARYDAVTHAAALAATPVRVAAGTGDPFAPGVRALEAALPRGSVVDLSKGCHDGAFFVAQEPPSLAFLADHLVAG
ncbi:MAG: alpha/beta hydrolase-fold protein [Actinomycetota bacterium]|nr:alpha/beta hydrolase-fold protein [Actinomycetota bacterium]